MTAKPIDAREIRARNDFPYVKNLLERGFKWVILKEIISYRLLNSGTDFPDSRSLLEAYYEHCSQRQYQESLKEQADYSSSTLTSSQQQPPPDLDYASNVPTSSFTAMTSTAPMSAASGSVGDWVSGSDQTPPELRDDSGLGLGTSGSTSSDKSSLTESSDDYEVRMETEKETARKLLNKLWCTVCNSQLVSVTFLPCGHLICCRMCAPRKLYCPVCQVKVDGTVETHVGIPRKEVGALGAGHISYS